MKMDASPKSWHSPPSAPGLGLSLDMVAMEDACAEGEMLWEVEMELASAREGVGGRSMAICLSRIVLEGSEDCQDMCYLRA